MKRKKPPAKSLRLTVILGAAAILAATAWAFYAPHPSGKVEASAMKRVPEQGPASTLPSATGRAPTPEAGAAVAPSPSPSPLEADLLSPPAIQPSPSARPRSPLERSPGYYPPADPESMSVITGKRDAPPVTLELSGGASSMDDLARMLLADISAKDEKAMHALRLTKHEFATICWPEFPNSRPVTNISVDDAWLFSITHSLAGVSRTVGVYGGRTLELVRVVSLPPFAYRNFNLYRDVTIVARDYGSRQELRLHFAPSIVERHGRYKALLFKD